MYNPSSEELSEESSEIPSIEEIIEQLEQFKNSDMVGQIYLMALGIAAMSEDSENIRKIASIDLGENSSKIKAAAHALMLMGAVESQNIQGLKLFTDAEIKLDFFFNDIDFSLLKIDDPDAQKSLTDLTNSEVNTNLHTIAARVCADFAYARGKTDFEIVKLLFENGVKPASAQDLLPAIVAGNFALFKYQFEIGEIDPNAEIFPIFGQNKMSLLHCTVFARDEADQGFPVHKGHLDILDFLCTKGANVKTEYKDSRSTPLATAMTSKIPALTERLVKHGAANFTPQDGCDYTHPLYPGILYSHFNAVQFLIEKGADFNVVIPYTAFGKKSDEDDQILSDDEYAVSPNNLRHLLARFGDKTLEQLDKERRPITFVKLASLVYKFNVEVWEKGDDVDNAAKVCLLLNFLHAVECFKSNEKNEAAKALANAIFYQQKLLRWGKPNNLLFRLINLLTDDEPEDEIYYLPTPELNAFKQLINPIKDSFLDHFNQTIVAWGGIENADNEKLLKAIVFEDLEAISEFLNNPPESGNLHTCDIYELDISIGLNSVQHYYFQALCLAARLESVSVTKKLHEIGIELLEPKALEAIHAAVIFRMLDLFSLEPIKTLHEAGIDPNLCVMQLDFSIFSKHENTHGSSKNPKVNDAVNNIVHYLETCLHSDEHRISHPAFGYLLRKGYTPESKEPTPKNQRLSESRYAFRIEDPNHHDNMPSDDNESSCDM